jgi:flagellar biosynthesis protein
MSDQKPPDTRKTATALGYTPESDSAPVVLASGRGRIAEQIIEIARVNQVPIHEDPLLASTLSKININDVIPPELYTVVAQVFAYIYRIRNHI